ncbi:class II aldolase/adducin family protein [bacterium]|nr:class II aldolase/adducin family protein [candidate division CSSED10-310 bacterium]
MTGLHAIKKEIVEIGRRIYNRGYAAANDGNISVRLDSERIVITPTGVSKGFMDPDSMVICSLEGKSLTRNACPSSEIKMHLTVYANRPEIQSVVHAHPPYATAFGITGIPLTQAMLPEVIMTLGGIPLVEYGTPGTDALSRPLIPYIKDHDAFLMQNHGALTIGNDLSTAYYRMETLEHFAHIAFISHLLGKIHTLPGPEVSKLLDIRRKQGGTGVFHPTACNSAAADACAILETGETVVESAITGASGPKPQEISEHFIAELVRKLLRELS